MDRFMNLTRRLLGVSREEVRMAEGEWKKGQRKRRQEHERNYKGTKTE
jgi:hypothetical protein